MDLNDTGNRVIAAIIVVLLIIGAWYLGHNDAKWSGAGTEATSTSTGTSTDDTGMTSTTTTQTTTTTTATTPTGGITTSDTGSNSIVIPDQAAGMTVNVTSVTLAQTGWLAVRDSSGSTLGAARLGAGAHSNVQISLLRSTTSGQSYQVLVYDDSDNGQFDLHVNKLVMNSDGSTAGTTFSAQ